MASAASISGSIISVIVHQLVKSLQLRLISLFNNLFAVKSVSKGTKNVTPQEVIINTSSDNNTRTALEFP